MLSAQEGEGMNRKDVFPISRYTGAARPGNPGPMDSIRNQEEDALMAALNSICTGAAPWLRSVLRIVTAFMFMAHGAQKLFGFPAPFPAEMGGSPGFFTLLWFAGVLEVFGGLLVLVGLFTRPVAFLLSGEMAVAYFMAHAPQSFWPLLNHGESAALYCFVFLYLAAAGAGPLSLDRIWGRDRYPGQSRLDQ